ncbi:PH domain-containing protein [Glycomyces endophyticus]
MPFPENILAPREEVRFYFRPHWLALLGACTRIAIYLAIFAVLGSVYINGESQMSDVVRLLLISGIVVDGVLLIRSAFQLFVIPVRILATRYIVTTDRVIFQWVVLSRSGSEVPVMQITAVEYHQSPIARLFRYGDLRFKSSASGSEVRFHFIRNPRQVRSEIYRLIEARSPKLDTTEQQT